MAPEVEIGGRAVGTGHPTYVIAELSANHNGSLERALAIVDAAADAGVDAVKLQTYTADSLTLDLDRRPFVVEGGSIWDGRTLHSIYEEAALPTAWHRPLIERGREQGVQVFSSPFDRAAVDLLVDLDVPALKIASPELVDLPLIAHAAASGKPLIMSTGMATTEEIDDAVATAREGGAGGVVLLRCKSSYPADPADMDLRTIPDMAARWGLPVGLSDHTLSSTSAVVAVALGACALEKHLTLARADGGPDGAFSLEPDELADLVRAVREAEAAVGEVAYGPSPSESVLLANRRSLFVVADVGEGEPFTEANVRSIRPADGLAPRLLPEVLGRRAAQAIERGTPLRADLVDPPLDQRRT